MSDHEEIATMIDDIMARESKLSDWEANFIDSLSKRIGEARSLTATQIVKLEEIWDRVTS